MSKTDDMDDFDRLLQDFIDTELKDFEEDDKKSDKKEEKKSDEIKVQSKKMPAIIKELAKEEKALVKAWLSYTTATSVIADTYKKTTMPIFSIKQEDLLPRYKPNVIDGFTRDTLLGWVILLETYPNQVSQIHPNSSDDQILGVAERTSDPLLQDALISYIEILIELEACDIAYRTRLANAKKKTLARQINEEHNIRREKIQKYIKALEDKEFPVDAHKLVMNYFKAASRDPEGAWNVLITNPAVFAPIELDKIPSTWWGFKKPKPEDGFKWNKKIAEFLAKLKV